MLCLKNVSKHKSPLKILTNIKNTCVHVCHFWLFPKMSFQRHQFPPCWPKLLAEPRNLVINKFYLQSMPTKATVAHLFELSQACNKVSYSIKHYFNTDLSNKYTPLLFFPLQWQHKLGNKLRIKQKKKNHL